MRGSCHCGALKYKAGAFVTPVTHCHCKTCRKTQAALFASTARVRREDFEWIGDVSGKRTYESTPGKFRHFCGTCGSQVMAEWPEQDTVILRVATLDDTPEVTEFRHIWTSHDLAWLDYSDDLDKFDEVP